ncbi:MAG: elongation factor P hydroxylase [Pseudomonadota bacterium]|nr:elongation factor P hydroxylase [Pseudomonadota bacterium]
MSDRCFGESVIAVFNGVFRETDHTVLRGGAAEPFYEPGAPSVIPFREDFDRSALHEVAHWCVAGRTRRKLPDYGYWYATDGRNAEQQSAFYSVEVKPQAIEALFCEALDLTFAVSVDNLSVDVNCSKIIEFKAAVDRQIVRFRQQGLPDRARRFSNALTLLAVERSG